jgi:CRISPR-associated endonuclease Csn1
MKKILGLDIGTNSIGWALVHEPTQDGENYAIAGMGVRIVPLSDDDNTEFTRGNAISKNAKRTAMRGPGVICSVTNCAGTSLRRCLKG